MKFFGLIWLVLWMVPLCSAAQKIQYSRQTFPYSFADATQLVPDVGGYHHVLRFKLNNKPAIHIFNAQLEYIGKTEVDHSVQEASDIRVIPMQRYYYLYFHSPGSLVHAVYKITGDGNVTDKTMLLEKLKDSVLTKSTATYQLQNFKNRLCVVSHSYYAELKKVASTVVTLNDDWSVFSRSKIYYPFGQGKETLQQVILTNDHLLVLKTSVDEEKGNTLQVVKANLQTGASLIKTFTAERLLYANASMVYAPDDSSLLVHASIREEGNFRRQLQPTFIARLDHQLTEVKPFSVIRIPARRNVVAGFLLVNSGKPVWLSPYTQPILRMARNQTQDFRGTSIYEQTFQLSTNSVRVDESEILHGQPTSVRFTVLNEMDRQIGDTLVENNGSFYDLQPRPNAQFSIGNKTCLLFLQNFSAKQKGLVLVHANKAGHVTTIPLPVFDRNEYLIPQTQAKKDYLLLPYRYKKEMGLVKVSLSFNESQK